MPCINPRTFFVFENGLTTLNPEAPGIVGSFPKGCGNCYDCAVRKAAEWSARLVCESKLYKNNLFLTLTYDDEHVGNYSLRQRDMAAFNKKLRRYLQDNGLPNIRIAYVGEYGGKTQRPHYHEIVFNLLLPDLAYFKGKEGRELYTSKLITELWGNGQVLIANFEPAAAGYITKYMVKTDPDKVDPGRRDYIHNGQRVQLEPEFFIASRRPGIGAGWIEKFHGDVRRDGTIIIEGKPAPLPWYMLDKLKALDPKKWYDITEARIEYAGKHLADSSAERAAVREIILRAKAKQAKATF